MSTQPILTLSPQRYLAQERAASFKSEYYQGETFAMAGASREHNLIVANLVGELRQALKDSNYEVYPSEMRVKVSASGLYTYPDVTIACGKPEFEDNELDTLLNPIVLIEVLSNSTEAYDRGTKAAHYRRLPSLQHYVLVSQYCCSVEIFSRSSDNIWTLSEASHLTESLRLQSPQVAIPLTEVYRNIQVDDLKLHF
ncbi:Uma2 family endonuclease [Pirellulaceae bacterium SH449]